MFCDQWRPAAFSAALIFFFFIFVFQIIIMGCTREVVTLPLGHYTNFIGTNIGGIFKNLHLFIILHLPNPMVHWISFSSIAQSDNETVQNYIVRLRSGARDCDFICPNCHLDLSHIYIKDQSIRRIANDALQADMLAKAG